MVTMVVMVMMAVAANILVRLGGDGRGDHRRNKGGGTKEFQSDHLSLLTYNDKTTRRKAGSSGNRPQVSPIPFKSAYHQFCHFVISLKHEPARQDRHPAFHLSA
jgi:hypothetical protein